MEPIINNKYNKYSFNLRRTFVGVNLIIAYHSIINIPYCNPRVPDPKWNELSFAFFVVKGSVKFLIGQKEVIVHENHVIFGLTNPEVILLDNGNEAEFYSFYFQIFNYSLPFYKPFPVPKREKEKIVTKKILNYMKIQTDLSIGSSNAIFMDLLFNWLRKADINENEKKAHYNIILDAELYINEHIEEKISIPKLAAQFNFSEQYFRKLFTKIVGCPPKKYIEQTKIERAFTLLRDTSLTISEIADKLNFSSCHHLANSFRKIYNMSPTECRQSTI